MADNVTSQKIVIDGAEASAGIKRVNSDLKTAAMDMNKSLVDNSKQFVQNETQIKQWGKSAVDELKRFGQASIENAALGAKAAALSLGNDALKRGARDAVGMIFELSEAHADMQSRLGASTEQMEKWDKAVFDSATKSKANVASVQDSFKSLVDTFNPDDVAKMMDPIGQGVLLAHGNAEATSDFLKKTVGAQGKTLSEGGMDALSGADLLKRRGQGFGTTESYMAALGSLDANAVQKSGLNMRDLAGIIAGVTKTGIDPARALAGVSGLLNANADGKLNPLATLLGSKNGSMMKNGKLNLDMLGSGQAKHLTNLGGDEATSLKLFQEMTRLQGAEGEALFNTIRHLDKFSETVDAVKKDQQTLGQSAKLAANSLGASYQSMKNEIVIGTTKILKSLETPFKSLLDGNIGKALSEAPHAIGGALSEASHHKALVGGALVSAGIGGMLLSSVKNTLFGGSKGGGLMKGIVSKAGMRVYVTNASEIRGESGPVGAIEDTASKMVKSGGFMAMFRGLAANAAVLGGASMGEIGAMGAGAIGMAGAGVAGAGLAGYGIGKGINYVTGNTGQMGEKLYDMIHVSVEVDSKDPLFLGRPKATDHVRDSKGR